MKKALIVVLPILFTAQACNFLFGDVFGEQGSGPRGVFFSTDSGETWEQSRTLAKKAKDERTLAGVRISDIFIEQANPQNLMAASINSGLYVSDSKGEKWFLLLPNFSARESFINPSNSQEIFVGGARNGFASIMKSADRGGVWEQIYHQPLEQDAVVNLTFDPRDSRVFYSGLSSGTVIKSADGGSSWKEAGSFKERIVKIGVASDDKRGVYLLTHSKIRRSDDGGSTWNELDINAPVKNFNNLFFDPRDSSVVYLGAENGLFRSANRGQSWSKLNLPAAPDVSKVSAGAVNPRNTRQIFVALNGTVYRSDDSGNSWKPVSLATRRIVSDIAIDPEEPNRIYAGLR